MLRLDFRPNCKKGSLARDGFFGDLEHFAKEINPPLAPFKLFLPFRLVCSGCSFDQNLCSQNQLLANVDVRHQVRNIFQRLVACFLNSWLFSPGLCESYCRNHSKFLSQGSPYFAPH